MRYLLKWPNGEHRVLDPWSLMASDWMWEPPDGKLALVPLPHDVGHGDGPVRDFANDAFDIARNAPKGEVDRWMAPGFELFRVEGAGSAQSAVIAALAATAAGQEQRWRRNLRMLTHADEDDE
jgi:hypothetical protein